MERLLHLATGLVLQNHPRVRRQSDTHVPARRMVPACASSAAASSDARGARKVQGFEQVARGSIEIRSNDAEGYKVPTAGMEAFFLSFMRMILQFQHIIGSLSLSEPVIPSRCRFRCLWLAPAPLHSMNLPHLWLALCYIILVLWSVVLCSLFSRRRLGGGGGSPCLRSRLSPP